MSKILYKKKGLKAWEAGRCKYPFIMCLGECKIIIDPAYKDDIGLLKHEQKHAHQYKKELFHSIKYKLSKKYRLECELEAYKEQIKEYKYKSIKECTWIIDALANKYNLKVTQRYIEKRVKELLTE